ncbi:MAG: 50S ribosomal protein L25 [Candidatus Omnitrophica bacterium]|nr:50S ribosomal protein L25 [Candidatus Omnitrophota bacterium]
MEAILLEAMLRSDAEIGKNSALRREGFVPCVVYGEGKKSLSLKIERSRLIKFMHAHHGGENMVITLKVNVGKKEEQKAVLIKEIQSHPVSGDIVHVDFNEISLTKKIVVKVPVESVGEPVGVKQDGGTLEHIIWEVEVECLPTQIPEKLTVDVANMKIGDAVYLKDISLPAGVVVKHDMDSLVFSLVPPMKEEAAPAAEAVAGEAAAATEPEVIKKEKKPAEEAEEEAKKE